MATPVTSTWTAQLCGACPAPMRDRIRGAFGGRRLPRGSYGRRPDPCIVMAADDGERVHVVVDCGRWGRVPAFATAPSTDVEGRIRADDLRALFAALGNSAAAALRSVHG